MKIATLELLQPLLEVLRQNPALEETGVGEFRVKGRDFLHFHETPQGIFADVLLAKGRVHMSVTTPADQQELLARIDEVLESLALHAGKADKRKHRRKKR